MEDESKVAGEDDRVIGAILDNRYRVLRKLGEGAMGEVYLAEHLELGRRDAVKLLRAELSKSDDFVARFRREARAANRVRHPNIVGVHDFARLADGTFMLVMEYVDGVSIEALLERSGPLPVVRTLRILEQLIDAMGQAHAAGVIHRDLKPGNLLLVEQPTGGERLKVLDFGIAKIIAADYETMARTGHGEVFGTPLYMSPEQCVGASVDARSDLYAIGCIAFEMLVGEPPFSSTSMVRLMTAQMLEPPRRPSDCHPRAQIPAWLDEVILRCLAKAPAARFQTAAELLQALRSLGDEASISTEPKRDEGDWAEDTHLDPPGAGSRALARAAHPGATHTEARQLLARLRDGVLSASPRLVVTVERLAALQADLVQRARSSTEAELAVAGAIEATRTRQAQIMFRLSELRSEPSQETAIVAEQATLTAALARVTKEQSLELERLHEAQITATVALSASEEAFREACRALWSELRLRANEREGFAEPLRILEALAQG